MLKLAKDKERIIGAKGKQKSDIKNIKQSKHIKDLSNNNIKDETIKKGKTSNVETESVKQKKQVDIGKKVATVKVNKVNRDAYERELRKLDERADFYNHVLDTSVTKLAISFGLGILVVFLIVKANVLTVETINDYLYTIGSMMILGYMFYYIISALIDRFEYWYLDDDRLVELEDSLWQNEDKVDDITIYPIYPNRKYVILNEYDDEELRELNHDYYVINYLNTITLYNCIYEDVIMLNKNEAIGTNAKNLNKVFVKVYEGAKNTLTVHSIRFKDASLTEILGTKEITIIEVEPSKYFEIKGN